MKVRIYTAVRYGEKNSAPVIVLDDVGNDWMEAVIVSRDMSLFTKAASRLLNRNSSINFLYTVEPKTEILLPDGDVLREFGTLSLGQQEEFQKLFYEKLPA